jgi:glycosyltransferase involved in cell wall biosynthesis
MPHYIIGNFIGKKVTGVQRVAVEISRRLVADPTVDFRLVCRRGTDLPEWLPADRVILLDHPRWMPSTAFQYFTVPLWLSVNQGELDHVINFSNVGMPWFRNLVICVHDCAVHHNPHWFGWKFRLLYQTLLPLVTSVAWRVTTVSAFSRDEISRYFPWTRNKLVVIPNGYDAWWREHGDLALPGEIEKTPYFLVVGSLDPRKRIDLVLKAWATLRIAHSAFESFRLVIVGGQFKTFSGSGLEAYAGDDSIRFLGYVRDELLRELYNKARGVINASDYEGFGLPIIEAEMAGARVIASDIPAFREVAGRSTVFFKAGDPMDLVRAIVDSGDSVRVEGGRQDNSYLASWDKAAEAYINIVQHKIP